MSGGRKLRPSVPKRRRSSHSELRCSIFRGCLAGAFLLQGAFTRLLSASFPDLQGAQPHDAIHPVVRRETIYQDHLDCRARVFLRSSRCIREIRSYDWWLQMSKWSHRKPHSA
ncbi:unnamed protein product [Cercospora beticola]|nr:unnamed protein product [Cercospora beticola]